METNVQRDPGGKHRLTGSETHAIADIHNQTEEQSLCRVSTQTEKLQKQKDSGRSEEAAGDSPEAGTSSHLPLFPERGALQPIL